MATPCQQFHANPAFNPRTGKRITPRGQVYRNLIRECGSPSSIISPIITNDSVTPNQNSSFQVDLLLSKLRSMNLGPSFTSIGTTLPVISSIGSTSPSQVFPTAQTSQIFQFPSISQHPILGIPVPEPIRSSQISGGIQLPMPRQIFTSPTFIAQASPPPKIEIPRASAITSQNVQNGCVISHIGRSGEDRYVTATLNGNIQMYGVFDGHGGRDVADYLRDNLPQTIAESLINVNFSDENAVRFAITNTYIEFDKRMFIQGLRSGSTAIIVLYQPGILYLVNLGDARAVVFTNNGQILAETRDHKPNDERTRIEAAGGFVTFTELSGGLGISRVNGVLAVSRAFGDFDFKYSRKQPAISNRSDPILYNPQGPVSVIPDITRVNLVSPFYILLASDGLYDVFSSQNAVNLILQSENIINSCQSIVDQARKGTTDDITVIISQL